MAARALLRKYMPYKKLLLVLNYTCLIVEKNSFVPLTVSLT